MNYIIINGKDVYLFELDNLEKAKEKAIVICDHSEEIIIRQVDSLYDTSSGFYYQLNSLEWT